MAEAEAAIDRLAALPSHIIPAMREITVLRLRALLACAHRDDTAYRDYRDRYRDIATSLGFEGHIAMAEAMPYRGKSGGLPQLVSKQTTYEALKSLSRICRERENRPVIWT